MDIGAGLGFGKEAPLSRVGQFNFFVDAALGSDSNDGTAGSPLRTFQEAVDRADESYTPGANNIFLAPGNYYGVNINDDDLLKVFGQGANPWDVTIRDFGNVIQINGGSDVRLFNMQVDGQNDTARGGANGIYADGLDYLYLNGVISRENGGSGLFAENVYKVKLYHSTFEDNGNWGAYINGSSNGGFAGNGSGYKVRSVGSHFNDNWDDGIRVDHYERVEMIASMAHDNGYIIDLTEGGQSDADGFEVENVDSVLVNGGSYNYNGRRGIDLDRIGDMTLIGVQASYNGNRGVDAEDIYDTAVVNGGDYQYNGDDGIKINGFGGELQLAGSRGETNGLIVNVYGGIFWNNSEDGIFVENAYEVNYHGVDARFNEDDGVSVHDSDKANVYGGYLFDNDDNGLELRDNTYSKVNGLASLENGSDGLDLRGGDRLNVLGGEYSNNGSYGIRARGDVFNANVEGPNGNGFGRLDRVDIKYATVLNNDDGVRVSYSYLAKMVGGTYSENYYDGIRMDNVSYGIFQDIVVINNGDYGLLFEAGSFDNPVEGGDSNWNRLEFVGGLYANNSYDGILISTNRGRGFEVNNIEVDAQHVVARDNGWNGFKVGNDFFDGDVVAEGNGFEFGSNLYIEMLGGYYGFNGYDGISLLSDVAFLSAEGLPQFGGGLLAASLTDVVAEYNGDNGVSGFGIVRGFVDNLPGFVGDNGNGDSEGSLIQVTRGSYSFNGDNGLRFNYAIFNEFGMPCIEGSGDIGIYSLATFDDVVAVQNGGNGVLFDVFVAQFDDGPKVAAEETIGGGQEYPALISFSGGVFNLNDRNGIKLTSEFEFVEEGGGGFGIVAARLENVEASLNGRNGALIRNFDPGVFRGDVDIINGVYNSNGKDGIHVRGFGDFYVDHVIAIGNDEDGVHSRDNWDTYISDDSIITNNGSQNVRID